VWLWEQKGSALCMAAWLCFKQSCQELNRNEAVRQEAKGYFSYYAQTFTAFYPNESHHHQNFIQAVALSFWEKKHLYVFPERK